MRIKQRNLHDMNGRELWLAIDFDGTIFFHPTKEEIEEHQKTNNGEFLGDIYKVDEYPVGKQIPYAIEMLKLMQSEGAKLIIWTMRSEKSLDIAIEACKKLGIVFDSIQVHPTQKQWTSSPKCHRTTLIDDSALGCPMLHDDVHGDYVDWLTIYHGWWTKR